MKDETYRQLGRLLCYMSSSARGLLDEPASYGPFRLIDAVSRLIETLQAEGPVDESLSRIGSLIEERKYLVMTDMGAFTKMLDEAVVELAAWLDSR